MDIWQLVAPQINPADKWGNPREIDPLLLIVFWIVIVESGWAAVVHSGFRAPETGRASQHHKGRAVDYHFASNRPLPIQIDIMLLILDRWGLNDKVGLGIYPTWATPGFHLDIRGEKARWGFIGDDEVGWQQALDFINRRFQ